MEHVTNEDRTREALASEAAATLATIAGWNTEPCPVILAPALSDYSYDPRAGIVVAPWRKHARLTRLMAAAREARVDIVQVEPGRTNAGQPTRYVALIICNNGNVEYYPALRLWTNGGESPFWLVPDPDEANLEPACFLLGAKALRPSSQSPFLNDAGRHAGLVHGDAAWTALTREASQ